MNNEQINNLRKTSELLGYAGKLAINHEEAKVREESNEIQTVLHEKYFGEKGEVYQAQQSANGDVDAFNASVDAIQTNVNNLDVATVRALDPNFSKYDDERIGNAIRLYQKTASPYFSYARENGGNAVADYKNNLDTKNTYDFLSGYYADRVDQVRIESRGDKNAYDAGMKALQTEIASLNLEGAQALGYEGVNQAGLDQFKNYSGATFQISYLRGASAIRNARLEQFDNTVNKNISDAFNTHAVSVDNLADVENSGEWFSSYIDNLSIDDVRGWGVSGTDEELEEMLKAYKTNTKDSWLAIGTNLTNEMQKAVISSDFEKGLTVEFGINYAPGTYSMDGSVSRENAERIYGYEYEKGNMDISDPYGYQKVGTKAGDTSLFSYCAIAQAFNYGNDVSNHTKTTDEIYGDFRKWAEEYLSGTSLSRDEQTILLEKTMDTIFDHNTHEMKQGSELYNAVAQKSNESKLKLETLTKNYPANSTDKRSLDECVSLFEQVGFEADNPYDISAMCSYLTQNFGFDVTPSMLQFADALSKNADLIATLPFSPRKESDVRVLTADGRFTAYNSEDALLERISDAIVGFNDDVYGKSVSTMYGTEIGEMYDAWLKENNLEGNDELEYRFFHTMNNAITSGMFTLDPTTRADLKKQADALDEGQYYAYCMSLYGTQIKNDTQLAQARALYPKTQYKTQTNELIDMLKKDLKSSGKDGEKIVETFFNGDMNFELDLMSQINSWLVPIEGKYVDNATIKENLNNTKQAIVDAYYQSLEKTEFKNIFAEINGYDELDGIKEILGSDERTLMNNYKNGSLNGIVSPEGVSAVYNVYMTGGAFGNNFRDAQDTYENLLATATQAMFPSVKGGYENLTNANKKKVELAVSIGTLHYEEMARTEAIFGKPFNGGCTSVLMNNGKYAYVFNNNTVVWQDTSNDSEYFIGKLSHTLSWKNFQPNADPSVKKTNLYYEDLEGVKFYKRTTSTRDEYFEATGNTDVYFDSDKQARRVDQKVYMDIYKDSPFLQIVEELGIRLNTSNPYPKMVTKVTNTTK